MASSGYPEKYEKGFEIAISKEVIGSVYVAGATIKGDKLLTSGGRVLGVIGKAGTLKEAIKKAYENVKGVSFANAYYRTDIGQKALSVKN
jgi:phosphoribosylamine--glycine ligase